MKTEESNIVRYEKKNEIILYDGIEDEISRLERFLKHELPLPVFSYLRTKRYALKHRVSLYKERKGIKE